MIGIYKITNPTNKIYIGQSVNIKRRFSEYKSPKFKDQIALMNSFKKYGVENHIFEVIEKCEIENLNERERYWQDYYDVCNSSKGLNCKLTKTKHKSGKCSSETIERIRLGSRGNTSHCKKIIDTSTGIIYDSIKIVAKTFNLSYGTLSMRLTGYYKNTTTFDYLKNYKKMELEFGLPKVRQQKQEKYVNEGCLTLLPTGTGLGRKFELNNKAKEMLNITDTNNQISFSFSGADIYIVNTSGCDNCSGLKVGKTTNGFSDKKHYEFIKTKTYNLKEEDTLELFLEETTNEFNGNKVYKLVSNQTSQNIQNSLQDNQVNELYSDEQPEYTQEQLDMLESKVYSEQTEVTSPEQLYNNITE